MQLAILARVSDANKIMSPCSACECRRQHGAASSITNCYPNYEINAAFSGIGSAHVTFAWQSNDGMLQQQGVLTFTGNVPAPLATTTPSVTPTETPFPNGSTTPTFATVQVSPMRLLGVRSQIHYQTFA